MTTTNVTSLRSKQDYFCMITTHINHNQNIIYINNPDKKQDGRQDRLNQFNCVANAQLFDSSEQTEVSPMSTAGLTIAAAFHIFIRITGHTN